MAFLTLAVESGFVAEFAGEGVEFQAGLAPEGQRLGGGYYQAAPFAAQGEVMRGRFFALFKRLVGQKDYSAAEAFSLAADGFLM